MCPLYDYLCPVCQKVEEHFKDFSANDEFSCECGTLMQRQFSVPNIKIDGVTSFRGKNLRKVDRNIFRRTDVELSTQTMGESIEHFKKQRVEKEIKQIKKDFKNTVNIK